MSHYKRNLGNMTGKELEESVVMDFYKNSNILITGGTGFIGRVLITKLLTSCATLNRIYLIIRCKKGKDPFTRCKELLGDPIFSGLRDKVPFLEKKIICIAGDCSLPDFGLSHPDRQLLIREITNVFHVAASVNFDEKIKTAINVNVQGVNELMNLCRSCRQLKSVVYVSSTYAYCVRDEVKEVIHDIPIRSKDILYLVNNLSSDRLELMKDGLIAPWPNAYNFSKAIAEDTIKENGIGIPIGIFRPSIVIGTSQEPVPGWINNLYGPTGVVAGVGSGLLRVLQVDTKLKADLVPVDTTVNALICTGWDINNKYNQLKNVKNTFPNEHTTGDIPFTPPLPPVYNFVTSRTNTVTWDDYLRYSMLHGMKIPPVKAMWYITLTTTKSEAFYKFLVLLCHYLPALFIDWMFKITGKKTRMLKMYTKIHKFSKVISYFTMREWSFDNGNTEELWSKLNDTDKRIFHFDMKALDWNSYFQRTIVGLRRYLFQDDVSTIPFAKKKMFCLWICHRLLQMGIVAFCIWIFLFWK